MITGHIHQHTIAIKLNCYVCIEYICYIFVTINCLIWIEYQIKLDTVMAKSESLDPYFNGW